MVHITSNIHKFVHNLLLYTHSKLTTQQTCFGETAGIIILQLQKVGTYSSPHIYLFTV